MLKEITKSIEQEEWYQFLIEELRAIIIEAIFTSRIELIRGKWEAGRRIREENKNFERKEIYDKQIIENIAKDLRISEKEVYRWMQFYRKYPEKDFDTVCQNLPEGKNISWSKLTRKYLPQPDSEKKKWQRYFDVWNFSAVDENYGIDCPGRIPYEIVANVLYYFTKPNDLVVDPMAGGGVLIDVCKKFKRRYLTYDIEIRRDDIKQRNLQEGFAKEAQNCDLIFIDPPYWKKKEEEYIANSISHFDRKDYLDFFKELAPKCRKILKPKGYLAFLMSNYIDYENPKNSIFTADYYSIFKEAGFIPIIEIQCPLSTEQYRGYDVDRAKKEKKLLIISRSLYLWENTREVNS